jgi:hypothetical protein
MARHPNAQASRVRAALQKLEPEIRKAFEEAMQRAARGVDQAALLDALDAGDIQRAVELLRINQAILFPLPEAVRAGYMQGAGLVAADLSGGLGARWAFDGNSENAQRWIRSRGAELVEGIVDETMQAARKVITEGLRDGTGHRSIARQITGRKVGRSRVGGFIGLDSQMTDDVINARSMLSDPDRIRDYFIKDRKTGRWKPRYQLSDRRFDSRVIKAIKEGRALSGPELDRVVEAHKSKALGYRGRRIARNEAHTALAAGREEAYEQVRNDPEVETITVRWQHGLSQEPREDHLAMDGTVIEMGETFNFPDGVQMKHPHDPAGGAKHSIGCRCIAVHRVRMRRD